MPEVITAPRATGRPRSRGGIFLAPAPDRRRLFGRRREHRARWVTLLAVAVLTLVVATTARVSLVAGGVVGMVALLVAVAALGWRSRR